MYPQNRKQQQRIAKRKVKVQQMIKEQEASLAAINPDEYDNQQDYQRALKQYKSKLERLQQELRTLEAGKMPGA